MRKLILLFTLAAVPLAAQPSPVISALFKNEKGFKDPAKNEALQELLAKKPTLDLYETAALGTAVALEKMLRDDPEALKRPNRFGWTLLHLAAFAGNVPNAELLLKKGADPNVRAKTKFRNTPLQAALLTGQYATSKLLLDHGADPLARQAKGFTAMHEAALLGRADLITLLLDHGAEINSRSDSNRTPLSEALRGKHEAVAEMLRAKGATTEPVADEEID